MASQILKFSQRIPSTAMFRTRVSLLRQPIGCSRWCSNLRKKAVFDGTVGVHVGRTLYPINNSEDLAWALNAKNADLAELEKSLREHEEKANVLRRVKEECDTSATRTTSRIAYASIAFFASEFAMMTYGTYFLYSWDIMEPISYLLGLLDVIAGYSFYAYYRTNYTAGDLAASFKKSITIKAYRKKQFSEAELDEIEEQIKVTRRRVFAVKSI